MKKERREAAAYPSTHPHPHTCRLQEHTPPPTHMQATGAGGRPHLLRSAFVGQVVLQAAAHRRSLERERLLGGEEEAEIGRDSNKN